VKVCILGDAQSVHLQRIAPGLARRGVEVTVVCHKPVPIPGVEVARFAVPPWGLAYPGRWSARRRAYLGDLFRRFDIVHVHFLHDWGFTTGLLALIGGECDGPRARGPLPHGRGSERRRRTSANTALDCGASVATPWGSDIVPPPGEDAPGPELIDARRAMLRHARAVTAWGPTFARQVADFAGLDPEAIHLLPLGVDLDLFRPVEDRSDRAARAPTVGFFKGFRPVYGATHLIRAIPLVLAECPTARFELIGDGPQGDECAGLAAALGVASVITWHPRQPHDRLPGFLAGWDVSVIPSECESFGAAALESSAMCVPVVASRVGGLVETVLEERTGLLVEPRSPRALARGIVQLLRDEPLRRRMGAAGRAFVAEHYEWGGILDRWVETYRRVIEEGAASGPSCRAAPVRKRSSPSQSGTDPGVIQTPIHPSASDHTGAVPVSSAQPRRLKPAAQGLCDAAPNARGSGEEDRSLTVAALKEGAIRPRRVLMISAVFPPVGGPGVQRSAKFAKYLPAFGWTPVVWCAGHLEGLPLDDTLLAELPDEVSILSFEGRSVGSRLRRGLWRRGRSASAGARASRKVAEWLADRDARRLVPDVMARWARESIVALRSIVRRERFDAIYSTYTPASNHVIARALHRATGWPWIADFRDLWTDDYTYVGHDARRRAAERALEQTILEEADRVIGVTARQTAILAARVPSAPEKFVTITNGFDPADFREPPRRRDPRASGGRFVLAHVGRFDHWRTGDALMEGLRRFAASLGEEREGVELRIVGHAGAQGREGLARAEVPATFTGYVTHRDAVGEMRAADALLLSVPDGRNADTVVPAKLFEYLAAGRPILVVGPVDGAAERIVRECRAGVTAEFEGQRVALGLRQMYEAWRGGRPLGGCPTDLLEPFSRVTQAGQLAALLGGRRDAGRYEDASRCEDTDGAAARDGGQRDGRRDAGRYEDAGRDQSAGGPGDGEHVDTASPAIGVGPVRAPARSGA
jgi:glycosyltransferase involved in cell wall biosynthesis